MQLYQNLKSTCRTIGYFFKHGWQFRNIRYWDYHYIYQVLSIMFDNFDKEFTRVSKTDYCHTTIEKDLRTIRTCKYLLNRLIKDEYSTRYDTKSEEYLSWLWENVKEEELPDGSIRMTFPDKEGRRDWARLHFEQEKKQKQNDLDLLCKLIRTRITKLWW